MARNSKKKSSIFPRESSSAEVDDSVYTVLNFLRKEIAAPKSPRLSYLNRVRLHLWLKLNRYKLLRRLQLDMERLNSTGLLEAQRLLGPLLVSDEFKEASGQSELDQQPEIPLPSVAPALWAERTSGREVSPVDFIRTHYKPWLGKGLRRGHLKSLDQPLYNAYAQWLRRHPEDSSLLPSEPYKKYTDEDLEDVWLTSAEQEAVRRLNAARQRKRKPK